MKDHLRNTADFISDAGLGNRWLNAGRAIENGRIGNPYARVFAERWTYTPTGSPCSEWYVYRTGEWCVQENELVRCYG